MWNGTQKEAKREQMSKQIKSHVGSVVPVLEDGNEDDEDCEEEEEEEGRGENKVRQLKKKRQNEE